MSHTFYVGSLSVGLFLGMLLLMEIGRLIAVRRLASDPDLAKAGFGAMEGWGLGASGASRRLLPSQAPAQRDDRHHHHPNHGRAGAPAAGHLRHAYCAGSSEEVQMTILRSSFL